MTDNRLTRCSACSAARAPQAPLRGTRSLSRLDAMILQAVATGLSSIQIGAQLHLSRQAVDYRIGQMLRELRVVNRPQLISRAYALGFFAARSWPPEFSAECIRES